MSAQLYNDIAEIRRRLAELESAMAEVQKLLLAQVRQSTPKGRAA